MNPASFRILHTNFHRGWGGQPSRILMLSKGLAGKGHEVVIAAPRGSMLAARAREQGIETLEGVQFLKSKHIASALGDVARLRRFLRGRRFDLIDAHGSQDLWVSAVATHGGERGPLLVYTRHNTKRVPNHVANRFLYRRWVDHLIVASGAVLDRYRPFLERGDLSRDRISMVHSSYRSDQFHPGVDGSAIRRELGADTADILVGVVGRLVPDKGGSYFLQAAARIAPDFPSARFLFVGRGTDEEKLRREAFELGLDERVVFMGFREDVPRITAALDLSVLPSVDCDASSAVLKEAMAVGRPVVATDIGGASEIIAHGQTGLVIPAADPGALASAISDILRREDRGRSMGRAGSERVRLEFNLDKLVEGTLEAYRHAMESSNQG
ncbi:MAG TPA: glycosyltransferase family 4 protein [Candidatus Polarisedimenticolia bacterium]|nr:glycosyltransferase family 4 protein [Candidatus Polarisedimenticolia bacterium]